MFRNFHMVSEQRFRDRKGKSIMGQDHDAEASTSRDSCRFSEDCTRDRNFDFSMLASRLEEEVDKSCCSIRTLKKLGTLIKGAGV